MGTSTCNLPRPSIRYLHATMVFLPVRTVAGVRLERYLDVTRGMRIGQGVRSLSREPTVPCQRMLATRQTRFCNLGGSCDVSALSNQVFANSSFFPELACSRVQARNPLQS